MNTTDIAVATYDTHLQAENAVRVLQRAGFDMKRVSIVGRDYTTEEHVVGFFSAGERARFFGKYGNFWGGLFDKLFGTAFLFVPLVGNIVVVGPLAAALVGGCEGAVAGGGFSALVVAFTGLGIPMDSVQRYQTAIRADRFLLIVHGDAKEIQRASNIVAAISTKNFDYHAVRKIIAGGGVYPRGRFPDDGAQECLETSFMEQSQRMLAVTRKYFEIDANVRKPWSRLHDRGVSSQRSVPAAHPLLHCSTSTAAPNT